MFETHVFGNTKHNQTLVFGDTKGFSPESPDSVSTSSLSIFRNGWAKALGGVMASVAVGHKKWGTLTTRKAQRRSTRGPRVQSTRRAEGRRQARPQGKHKGEVAGGLTRAGRIPISSTAHREKPLLAQHQSGHKELDTHSGACETSRL